jgi:hypothetical protein
MAAALACSPAAENEPEAPTPEEVANDLLAADRAFSDSSATGDLVAGLSRMFSTDVRLLMAGQVARGRDSAAALLRSVPVNVTARATWTPVRAGVSADGAHGYTAGFQEIQPAEGPALYAKYVAYWIRTSSGWRVAAYKRAPRREGGGAAMLPPVLPERMLAVSPTPAEMEEYRGSLRAAELAFSDSGGRDIGAAFRFFGAPEAINSGGPDDANFRVGPEEIASGVAASIPAGAAISWGPDEVSVAPSGDLGVSIGFIIVTPKAGEASRIPFFTVWRRARLSDPWRYVAE